MKLTKLFTAAVAVATLTAALTACGDPAGTDGPSGTPQTGGDLVVARADEVVSLLPSVPGDNASIWTIEEIYDTLVKPSQDGRSVVPSLATSWKQSADKLSWTFQLRNDATFTNGNLVTSADVKFSIEQNQKPSAPFAFMDRLITQIDTPNDDTVVFHTAKPWAPLPSAMSLYANSIVPKDYAGMTEAEFAEKPIGSGPFMLESWDRGSSLKIVKNPDYWEEGVPKLDSVTFATVPDSNTRATQLASGQIQINEFPPFSSVSSLENQQDVKVTAFPSSSVFFLGLNTSRAPFDDVNVRKAISQTIDKEAINKAVFYGHGAIAATFMSPVLWAHNDTIESPNFDVAAAKATLAKSTVPNGFSTTLNVPSGDQLQKTLAELVQASLGKIGIKVEIKTLDPAANYADRNAGNYDMAGGYYTTDIGDPDEIARLVGTESGGFHAQFTFFDDPAMEELADKASGATDQDTRIESYDEMQQIFADQVPLIPLLYAPSMYSYSSRVNGFQPGGTGNYFLENVWLSK